MKNLINFASIIFCLFLTVAVPAQTNLSFETGTNPGAFNTVYAGQNNISGWNVDFGSVDYIGSHWQASQGSRSIDLNGQNQRGQISQDITTVAGWTYKVTFDLSGNPDGGPQTKFMYVGADKKDYQFYSYVTGSNTRTDMQWAPQTYHFTAEYPYAFISFTSAINGFYGPTLDNINISVETQVCHFGIKTVDLSAPDVAVHLAHGDSAGPCAVE